MPKLKKKRPDPVPNPDVAALWGERMRKIYAPRQTQIMDFLVERTREAFAAHDNELLPTAEEVAGAIGISGSHARQLLRDLVKTGNVEFFPFRPRRYAWKMEQKE